MRIKKWFLIFAGLLIIISPSCRKENNQLILVLQPDSINGKDAVFCSIVPDNNYGASEDIHLYTWTQGGILNVQRVVIDFDLASIPSGSVIDYALLSLYFNKTSKYKPALGMPDGSNSYGENDFFIQRITSPWNQNTVTWNTQPTTTEQNQIFVPKITYPEQEFPAIDVTKLVQDMINDKANSHGFLLKFQIEQPYKVIFFASSDHLDKSVRPKLEVYYKIEK